MKSSPPLPIVLVGCGAVSQLFYSPAIRTLEKTGHVSLKAIVDTLDAPRSRLAAVFPKATAASSLGTVDISSGSLVIIASPPAHHHDQTIEALGRGLHVLCEKPMASSSAECEAMHQASVDNGRILAIGHYKRFYPSSRTLKILCGGNSPLGALRCFEIHEGGPFNWPAASPSFFRKEQTPGGVLLDIGIHVFDLLVWWLGDPDSIDHQDDAMGGLEINTRTELTFGSVRGIVRLSRDWATPQRYSFVFEHGKVHWTVNDANGLTFEIEGLSHSLKSLLTEKSGQPAPTNPQSFIAQLLHVSDAIRDGTPVLTDGREGARALRLIEACYASKKPLPQPWLSPAEQAAANRLATFP